MVKGEDTGNMDDGLFNRGNTEVLEFDQWNVGIHGKTGQVALGVRSKFLASVIKTTILFMRPDDAIRMGEQLTACGVNAKAARLKDKHDSNGGTVI